MQRPRLYFFIVAALFFYEFVSGIYIWLGRDFSEFYQFNLLFHVFAGLFFLVPFFLFQFIHYRRVTPGLFVTAQTVAAGLRPVSGSSADFNGDGFADIVTANEGSQDLSIILGNGGGTFTPEVRLILGFTPVAVVAGEFSGDSFADMVVTAASGAVLFSGNGDGTFPPAVPYTGTAVRDVIVADVNTDGLQDIVSVNAGGGISVASIILSFPHALGGNPDRDSGSPVKTFGDDKEGGNIRG